MMAFVQINQSLFLKSNSQCVAAVNLASRTLGMINKTIVNKDSKTLLKLYQSLDRPKPKTGILCTRMEAILTERYRPIRESAEKGNSDDG